MAKSKLIANDPLIKVVDFKKHFPLKKTRLFQKEVLSVKANDGIDLVINKGETLGLVGESGCGKSTFGRVLLQLYPLTSGKAIYYGYSLEEFSPRYLFKEIKKLKSYREKYEYLEYKKLPAIEAEIERLKNDAAENDKRKALKEEVSRLKAINKELEKKSLDNFGTFITSNNKNAIVKFPFLDKIIYNNEKKIKINKAKISNFEKQLENAKKVNNDQANKEVELIKKLLKSADINQKAELNKKLAIAERKAKAHIIAIEIKIKEANKNINIALSDNESHIKAIKSSLSKNIELNTEILNELVKIKLQHLSNENLIKQHEYVINYQKQYDQIDYVTKKMEKYLDNASNVTGALILHKDPETITRDLLGFTDAVHKKQLLLDKFKLIEAKHFRSNKKLEENKDKYTEWQIDVLSERIEKLANKMDELTKEMDTLYLLEKEYKGKLDSYLEVVKNHKFYEKLEANKELGIDLARLTKEEMRSLRQDLQIIFQDPYSSLNPKMTVGQIIGEGMKAHNLDKLSHDGYQEAIMKVMEKCGLAPYMVHRYPHQFSGGQRQRIGIARALALNPKFVVCDEAVSALDVSIQSQIINLLEDLRDEDNLTYLFISHDLSVIKHISNRIGVMYLGNIVELADSEEIYKKPLHPYTKALISAIPTTEQGEKKRILLEGDIPSNVFPPSGCKFRTRCPLARKECAVDVPNLREVEPGRFVACHFYEETETIRAS